MRKLRIYLDTSVISYLEQDDVPEKMEQTRELWKILKLGKYDIVISDLVVKVISKCQDEKKELFKEYLSEDNVIHKRNYLKIFIRSTKCGIRLYKAKKKIIINHYKKKKIRKNVNYLYIIITIYNKKRGKI